MRPDTWTFAAVVLLCAAGAVCAQTTAPEGHASSRPADPTKRVPPTTAPADEAAALKLYARGDYKAVIELLTPEYQAGRANIQRRLLLARALLHEGRQADGLAVLQSVLKSDNENPEANNLAGQTLFAAGKFKEALDFLQHAYRLRKDPAIAGTLGQCHFALGESAKAKELLEVAIKGDIRDPANSFVLGKIHLANGAGALAEKYFLMAQDAGLNTAELHHLLGQTYLLERKFVGPIIARRLAGSPKPGEVVDEYMVIGKLEGSADQYQVCTRYCALYEGGLLHLITILKTRIPPGSLDNSRVLPSEVPESAENAAMKSDALYMLAAGWFAAGKFDLAKENLDKLSDSAKQQADRRTYELRAELQLATKDFAGLNKTLTTGQAAKAFDARDVSDFSYRAAVALRADGKFAEAVEMLKQADAAVPTSANVLRALAALSVTTGKGAEARTYYARIVELFPDAADIDQLRNTLKRLNEEAGIKGTTTAPEE